MNNGRVSDNIEQGNYVDSFQNLSVDDVAFITGDVNSESAGAQSDWFIDSAATKHMSFEKESFVDFCQFDEPKGVALGDNAVIMAEGKGTVCLPIYDAALSKTTRVSLRNVLFVPNLKKNLISVPTITESENPDDPDDCFEVLFDNEKCVVRKDGKFLMKLGQKMEGSRLYRASTKLEYANIAEASSVDLWHCRLGHLNKAMLISLLRRRWQLVSPIQPTTLQVMNANLVC